VTTAVVIHWTFQIVEDVDLFQHGEAVMDALLAQQECTPEVLDFAVSVDAEKSLVEIELTVQGVSYETAVAVGQATIRAAIHATGAGTPTWPTRDDMLSMVPTDLQTSTMEAI
jgi:hypothetical protein